MNEDNSVGTSSATGIQASMETNKFSSVADGTLSFSVRGSKDAVAAFTQEVLHGLLEEASIQRLEVTSFSSYTNAHYNNQFQSGTPVPSIG